MESVQHLPVPGKFRVPPGGRRVGGEEHREHHQPHPAPVCALAAPEKHKLSGSKFNSFRLLESHFNIGLAWPVMIDITQSPPHTSHLTDPPPVGSQVLLVVCRVGWMVDVNIRYYVHKSHTDGR